MNHLLVTAPDPKLAHEFYFKQIYTDNKDLEYLCNQYNFKTRDPYNWKWELFSAILVGDKAKDANSGADLCNFEVKSAQDATSGFEYQYHPNSWEAKLEEDKRVSHILIRHSSNYENLNVSLVEGPKLLDFFELWEPAIRTYWQTESSNKRFRKSIPYRVIQKRGKTICVIDKTKLLYFDLSGIDNDLILKPIKKK